ncbi:MAG TPA: gliding motility protein GldM [Bacteroidia bacterium]|nr:gliding motility protein GldM [Bacteroidia bacterium]
MAGGGKETPRQKMIGMMYLVLTALLAMNVSKDILKAFVTVNESLERTNNNFNNNTLKVMKAFEESKASTPQAAPYYAKAVIAEKMTNDLFNYIEKLKHELIAHTDGNPGGDTLRLRYVDAKDNYDKPTHLLIGDDERNPKSGEFSAVELKTKITEVHDNLIKMIDDMQKHKETRFLQSDYESLKKKIETIKPDAGDEKEDGVPVTWEILNFYHLPLAGTITNLTKMQADLKNVEAEIVSNFSGAAGKVMVKFDKLSAKVVAPSSYIQSGQKYEADIFIAASSSDFKKENMEIVVNPASYDSVKGTITGGTPVELSPDGMGKYSTGTQGQGEQKYKAVIKFKQPTGEYKFYTYETSYMVAAPSVAVSADQMNVFYVGVPNPVSVSAAGVSPTDLIVSPTGGGVRSTSKGAGVFEFNFSSPGECVVNVSSKNPGGTGSKSQGSKKFRVKPLPPPLTTVGGFSGSIDMKKSQLSTIGGVGAQAPGFDFKANFIVTGFEITGSVKGQTKIATCTGNSLSADAKAIIMGAGPGSKIFIDQVKVKGPDGKMCPNVPGVTIKVKA